MSDSAQRAGWYPDPDGDSGERWWNGVGWSETRRGGPNQPVSVLPPAPSAPSAPSPVWQQSSGGSPVPPPSPPYPNPYAVPTAQMQGQGASPNPQALRGFVVGIVSIVFNFLLIPSIIAIVLSVRGMARARELSGVPGNGSGLATAGLVLGVLGLIGGLFMTFIVILALVLPPTS